ncbi:MAG: hypothetical protein CMH63_02375 [Nanoarchaeota archaeon]|nr:hypothetical protein [Nanoarchaeota archaeon]
MNDLYLGLRESDNGVYQIVIYRRCEPSDRDSVHAEKLGEVMFDPDGDIGKLATQLSEFIKEQESI